MWFMFDDHSLRTGSDTEPDQRSDGSLSTGSALVTFVKAWAAGIDPTQLESEAAVCLAGSLHAARAVLNGVLVRVGDQARTLEQAGTGPPAEETLTGGGHAPALTGRDLAAASEVTAAFPELGRVVRAGLAQQDTVAAVVRLWWRLDDTERTRLVKLCDTELAGKIQSLPADTFTALVQRRGRAIRNDDGAADAEAAETANEVVRRRLGNGRYRYVLEVDPLTDEELWPAIETKAWATLNSHQDIDKRRSLDGHLRAEALADLLRAGAADNRHGLPRSHALSLVVDHHTLLQQQPHDETVCESERGTPVPLGLLHRYACDAVIDSTHLAPTGRPFDHGRTRRTASPRQKRALRAHYQGCIITRTPLVDCEIHHLDFWEEGGPSDYDNLVPLSRRWHHLIHDHHWRLSRNQEGGFELTRPDGTHHKTFPPPIPITRRHDIAA
jgi:hypothetical protein